MIYIDTVSILSFNRMFQVVFPGVFFFPPEYYSWWWSSTASVGYRIAIVLYFFLARLLLLELSHILCHAAMLSITHISDISTYGLCCYSWLYSCRAHSTLHKYHLAAIFNCTHILSSIAYCFIVEIYQTNKWYFSRWSATSLLGLRRNEKSTKQTAEQNPVHQFCL